MPRKLKEGKGLSPDPLACAIELLVVDMTMDVGVDVIVGTLILDQMRMRPLRRFPVNTVLRDYEFRSGDDGVVQFGP